MAELLATWLGSISGECISGFTSRIFLTVVRSRAAMRARVSPGCTLYVEPMTTGRKERKITSCSPCLVSQDRNKCRATYMRLHVDAAKRYSLDERREGGGREEGGSEDQGALPDQ